LADSIVGAGPRHANAFGPQSPPDPLLVLPPEPLAPATAPPLPAAAVAPALSPLAPAVAVLPAVPDMPAMPAGAGVPPPIAAVPDLAPLPPPPIEVGALPALPAAPLLPHSHVPDVCVAHIIEPGSPFAHVQSMPG
jgi:hypothetical protein